MTDSADNAAVRSTLTGADLASKIFVVCGDKKLVRHLSFAKAAGERLNSLRISVGSTYGTALALKNVSFSRQYRRAIDKILSFYKIPENDPRPKEMERTSGDSCTPNLSNRAATRIEVIEDLAFPYDAEGVETASTPPTNSLYASDRAQCSPTAWFGASRTGRPEMNSSRACKWPSERQGNQLKPRKHSLRPAVRESSESTLRRATVCAYRSKVAQA